VPVFDKSARRDGAFARADFAYDLDEDYYTCPAGKGAEALSPLLRSRPGHAARCRRGDTHLIRDTLVAGR
jgi:hypothetical protein